MLVDIICALLVCSLCIDAQPAASNQIHHSFNEATITIHCRYHEVEHQIRARKQCLSSDGLCLPAANSAQILVSRSETWLSVVRKVSHSLGLSTIAVNLYDTTGRKLTPADAASFASLPPHEFAQLSHNQRLLVQTPIAVANRKLFQDPRVNAPVGQAALWDMLMALVGSSLYRDQQLTKQVLIELDQVHSKLECGRWQALLDYYNGAWEPHSQLQGYLGRFVDVFSLGDIRSHAAVSLFERCLLPAVCAHAAVLTTHKLPYAKMDHLSQVGQDLWVLRHYAGMKDGVFVDIGASDGILGSNTYLLEKCFGWRGLCVEPRATEMDKLKVARTCSTAQAALSDTTGEGELILAGGLSGLERHQNVLNAARVKQYIGGNKQAQRLRVNISTFERAVNDASLGRRIDFLSIDIEGAELAVLKTIDWEHRDIGALAIENNDMAPELCEFLEEKGYECLGHLHFLDELFVKR